MGLGAGIIAGAMQGVGDGMQQVADQKAKLWGQEEINQQMSDLAVQRQATLKALDFQMRMKAIQGQPAAQQSNGATSQPTGAPASDADPAAPQVPAPTPSPQQSTTLPMLQAAIQHVESNGNPNAVSPQGATGTMQIMPATFAQYAKPGEVYTNDADRTAAALRKISDDYNHFGGDIGKTAAAYIGGRGAINADGSIRDDVADSLGTTPAAYSQKILATMQQMRNAQPIAASGGASGSQPTPTMSVPAAVSHMSAYKFNPKTGTLEPTPEFQMAEAQAEFANPGAGADLRKVNEPSEAEKLTAALQRVGKNSPEGAVIQRQLDALGYIAPVSLRSERYIDSKGNIHTLPGSAPQGHMNVQNADGSWSIVKVNGGNEAIADNLAATNTQTLAPTDKSPVDAQGRPIPVTIADAVALGKSGQGAGMSPAQQAMVASNADAAKVNAGLPDVVNASKRSRAGLENALTILNGVKATGPGTAISAELWSKLANAMPINLSTPDSDKYQLLLKYLNNSLATGSAVTGANGSDARFEQFSHGQPNGETMNVGPLRQALQYTLSQHDATIAGAEYIQKMRAQLAQQGVPNPDQVAQQAWSSIYNPRAFELNRMTPNEQADFVSHLTPAEAQKLRAQRDAMTQAKVFQ